MTETLKNDTKTEMESTLFHKEQKKWSWKGEGGRGKGKYVAGFPYYMNPKCWTKINKDIHQSDGTLLFFKI